MDLSLAAQACRSACIVLLVPVFAAESPTPAVGTARLVRAGKTSDISVVINNFIGSSVVVTSKNNYSRNIVVIKISGLGNKIRFTVSSTHL